MTKLAEIHESYINGQGKQMVEQIEEYTNYDFWPDYYQYLIGHYSYDPNEILEAFSNVVIRYNRIKNR